MLVHLNGRLVPERDAVVSVFDRGFLYGDGVFESMRAHSGRVFRLDRHLERLRRSADLVGFGRLPDDARLRAEIAEVLSANRLTEARLRLTVTRGPGIPGDYVESGGEPTRVLSAAPFTGLDPRRYEMGVEVEVAGRSAVPADCLDPAIKTTSRIASVLARRDAAARGAFEALLLDAEGRLTEGTVSNVFLAAGGRLLTPEAPSGALPGVTRAAVLEIARASGLPVAEMRVPRTLLASAEEVFLTNTTWEVLPVVKADGRPVGEGRPGAIARDLLARLRELVRRECAGA